MVTLTAKVLRKKESILQHLQNGPSMMRTPYIIADSTGAVELTLWGVPEQISVGNSYIFKKVTVKCFDSKELSTNPETTFKKTSDIKDAVAEMLFKPKQELIKVLTALIGSQCYFHLLLLQLVLCGVAALKSLPVHHP